MESNWRYEGIKSLGRSFELQERAVGTAISHQSDTRKSRSEMAEHWVSNKAGLDATDCNQMTRKYLNSRNESLLDVLRTNNNERKNEEWSRLNVGQFRPFGGSLPISSIQRLSVSSDSSIDASDISLTRPSAAFQDERQMTEIEGLSALKACYQQLLDLQMTRIDYERDLGRSSLMIPVFEPTVFTINELMELVEFSQIQFKSLIEAIQAHENILQPTYVAYLGTIKDELCQANNVHMHYAGYEVQNRKDTSAKSCTSTTDLCIQQLKNLMGAWQNLATLLTNAIRKSEPVVILLQIFKKLVQDVQAQLVWGFCTKNLDFKNVVKENKTVQSTHKMNNLPFRAEDPFQLPKVRYPPNTRQQCTPRYTSPK